MPSTRSYYVAQYVCLLYFHSFTLPVFIDACIGQIRVPPRKGVLVTWRTITILVILASRVNSHIIVCTSCIAYCPPT